MMDTTTCVASYWPACPHEIKLDSTFAKAPVCLRSEVYVGRSDSGFLIRPRFLRCMTYPHTPGAVMLDLITDCIARVDHLNRQLGDRLTDSPTQQDAVLLDLHRVHGELLACIGHLERVRAKRL